METASFSDPSPSRHDPEMREPHAPEERHNGMKERHQIRYRALTHQAGWLLASLLLLGLFACGRQDETGREGAVALDAEITYSRAGGIAGVSQEWVIHLDGTVDGPGDQALVVPPEAVHELLEVSAAADLAGAMAGPTPDACCDQFVYTLTFTAGEQSWRISTTDTAEEDDVVSELFALAEALITTAQPAS